MSEKSIAEIIGWEWRGSLPNSDGMVWGSWCPKDVSYSDGSPPNVDDMLAWVVARRPLENESFTAVASVTILAGETGVVVVISDAHGDEADFWAPTLHEALEATVRYLDGCM